MTDAGDDLKDRLPGIMADARYMVGNPSGWDSYDDGASEVIRGLLARIEHLERALEPFAVRVPLTEPQLDTAMRNAREAIRSRTESRE